jgi:hypothetical protein
MAERTAQTMTTSLSCFWRTAAFAEEVDAWVDMVLSIDDRHALSRIYKGDFT